MPTCVNHPWDETAAGCQVCGLPLCPSCLVEFQGRRVCASCRDQRVAYLQGVQDPSRPATAAEHMIPARNPMALSGYYVGVFSLVPCAALLLGPAALVLGILALRAIRQNPNLPGKAHAIIAVVLGSLTGLTNWGLLALGVGAAVFQR